MEREIEIERVRDRVTDRSSGREQERERERLREGVSVRKRGSDREGRR